MRRVPLEEAYVPQRSPTKRPSDIINTAVRREQEARARGVISQGSGLGVNREEDWAAGRLPSARHSAGVANAGVCDVCSRIHDPGHLQRSLTFC